LRAISTEEWAENNLRPYEACDGRLAEAVRESAGAAKGVRSLLPT
jgi:hypothetical protein